MHSIELLTAERPPYRPTDGERTSKKMPLTYFEDRPFDRNRRLLVSEAARLRAVHHLLNRHDLDPIDARMLPPHMVVKYLKQLRPMRLKRVASRRNRWYRLTHS